MSGEAKLPRGMDLSLRNRALAASAPGAWNGSLDRADAIEVAQLYEELDTLRTVLFDASTLLGTAQFRTKRFNEIRDEIVGRARAALDGEGTKP